MSDEDFEKGGPCSTHIRTLMTVNTSVDSKLQKKLVYLEKQRLSSISYMKIKRLEICEFIKRVRQCPSDKLPAYKKYIEKEQDANMVLKSQCEPYNDEKTLDTNLVVGRSDGGDSNNGAILLTLPEIDTNRRQSKHFTVKKNQVRYATTFPPPLVPPPKCYRKRHLSRQPTLYRSYTTVDQSKLAGQEKSGHIKGSTKTKSVQVPLAMRIEKFVTELDLYIREFTVCQ